MDDRPRRAGSDCDCRREQGASACRGPRCSRRTAHGEGDPHLQVHRGATTYLRRPPPSFLRSGPGAITQQQAGLSALDWPDSCRRAPNLGAQRLVALDVRALDGAGCWVRLFLRKDRADRAARVCGRCTHSSVQTARARSATRICAHSGLQRSLWVPRTPSKSSSCTLTDGLLASDDFAWRSPSRSSSTTSPVSGPAPSCTAWSTQPSSTERPGARRAAWEQAPRKTGVQEKKAVLGEVVVVFEAEVGDGLLTGQKAQRVLELGQLDEQIVLGVDAGRADCGDLK